MYDFYLGSCLGDIGPLDAVPTSETEHHLMRGAGANARLFSKGGLSTVGAGVVRVRVVSSRNYLRDGDSPTARGAPGESQQGQAKMRETVDEVLSRVRKNKRHRMARDKSAAPAAVDWTKQANLLPAEEKNVDNSNKNAVSARTAEVLERVRSRKLLARNDVTKRPE